MRKALLTGIALAALATMGACSPSDGGNTDLTIVDKQAGDPKWTPLVDDFIAGWFRLDPVFEVYQGKHEFDGQLTDWTVAGLTKQNAFQHQAIQNAHHSPTETMGSKHRSERDYHGQVAK